MKQVSSTPFVIAPSADFSDRHPQLKHLAKSLAQSYVQDGAQGHLVTDQALEKVGSALWAALDLEDEFKAALKKARSGNQVLPIIIESDQSDIQNLPWETLFHPQLGFLGREQAFTLSRRLEPPFEPADQEPADQGPLRVLLFSSLPNEYQGEKGRLAIEQEQEHVLEALLQPVMQGKVILQTPNTGEFSSLKTELDTFNPHLVFLSGHGAFVKTDQLGTTGYGSFCFENADGQADIVSATELAKAFIGSSVQCCVLSACESGKASDQLTNGLAQALLEIGLPHVIGMRESILDIAGILFAREFCQAIGNRQRVDLALQKARDKIAKLTPENQNVTDPEPNWRDQQTAEADIRRTQWSLPGLYSRDPSTPLIDWDFDPVKPDQNPLNRELEGLSLPSKFRGRRLELRKLKQALLNGKCKELLITGPGGQGKTAFAGELALTLHKAGYPTIAWSATDKEASDKQGLGSKASNTEDFGWQAYLQRLESALSKDLAEQHGTYCRKNPDTTARQQHLLSSLLAQHQNRLVLVLDNLESLQDIQTRELKAQDVQTFIDIARSLQPQGLTLILTSRWLLPEWSLPDGSFENHLSLEHLNYGDFLQLTLLLGPKLSALVDRRNRLRKVYKVLHGNARGLEYFAAAVAGMGLEQEEEFLARLAEQEAELQTNMALEELLNQCQPHELQLLHRMQVFEVPVPVEGLKKISDSPKQVPPILDELMARSLVEHSYSLRWQTEEYFCSPLVTTTVNRKLQRPVGANIGAQAAEFHLWLYKNERRTLNYAYIVERALRKAGEDDQARRFTLDRIVGPMNMAGRTQALVDHWLPDCCQSTTPLIKSEALGQTGKQHLHLGDYETALNYLKQSLAIQQEIGDKAGEGTTLNNISQIHDARGDYETALNYLKQSLAIQQEIGDKAGEGTTLNNISQIFKARGDYETALNYLKQSLAIRQEIGDKAGEGTTLNNISQIHDARGDYETALNYLKQSLAIRQEIGDKAGEGTTLNNISQIHDARGDYETALNYLKQSLAIQQEIGDKAGEGTTLNNMSAIAYAQGDYETALNYLKQSLAIRQEIGDKAGEGTTLNNISQIFKARGDYETALNYLKQSLAIQQEIGDKAGEGTTLNNISQIHDARGDYETALNYLKQSLAIQQEIGDKAGEGTTLNNMSAIAYAQGDYETALNYLKQSLAIQQEIGDIAGLCATLFNIGHIHLQNKAIDEAIGAWVSVYRLAKPRQLAQALEALEGLAGQLGGEGGLLFWEQLSQRAESGDGDD